MPEKSTHGGVQRGGMEPSQGTGNRGGSQVLCVHWSHLGILLMIFTKIFCWFKPLPLPVAVGKTWFRRELRANRDNLSSRLPFACGVARNSIEKGKKKAE